MDFFKKNKVRMAHLLVFVLFAGTVIFYIRPFLIDIGNNAKQLFETKRDYKFIRDESGKINAVRGDYKNMEPDLDKMSAFLIDSKTPIDLIKFWEATAKEENLDIDVGSYPTEKEDKDPWPSMGLQIKLSGAFSGVMKFLDKIESSKYFFEIRSLSIIKGADKTDEKTGKVISSGVSAALGLKVYTK